jgi:predicted TIM-barrel fold metal-dependent hydrolase
LAKDDFSESGADAATLIQIQATNEESLQKIIDAHVHLSERRDDALIRFARLNGLRYTLDELLGTMREYNIVRGLLLSPPLQGSHPLSNDRIIALCARSGGMLVPVITVEPTAKEVKAAVKLAEDHRKEVKAFKVRLGYVKASAESHVFSSVYDYAESKGLPVLFHTGDTAFSTGDLARSHPLTLDGLANKREELKIILCHFGNPWFEDVAELIYKHPNVYADISGLITGSRGYAENYVEWLAKKISEAIYYAGGAEKVLFGTDYPVTKHSEAMALVRRLEVGERDKEKILWNNAERVFGL